MKVGKKRFKCLQGVCMQVHVHSSEGGDRNCFQKCYSYQRLHIVSTCPTLRFTISRSLKMINLSDMIKGQQELQMR